MSIKNFLIVLLATAIFLSLALFAAISNKYMNDYFDDYIDSTYDDNVESISEFARLAIVEGHQPRSLLRSYVKDPIYYVEIYNLSGEAVSFSGNTMNNIFIFDPNTMVIDSYDIYNDTEIIGEVLISRELRTRETETHKLFNKALLYGAVISLVTTLIAVGTLLFFLIKSISNNVGDIIEYTTDDDKKVKKSRIMELNTITEAIRDFRIKLRLKEKVKKQKFDKLLHETKTPLTIIKSQLEGVADGIYEMDKEKVSSMMESVDNLDEMLKNITNIIEDVSSEDEIVMEEMDYAIEIEKIVKSLSAKYRKKNIELIFDKGRLKIKTNKELLNQAIYNLCINAYKYTQKGNVIITVDDEEKTITIKDTGIGVKEGDLQKIFDPYFRGGNVKDIKGEGLGLSNAKDNIEKLGGKITLKSEIGKFAEFKIFF